MAHFFCDNVKIIKYFNDVLKKNYNTILSNLITLNTKIHQKEWNLFYSYFTVASSSHFEYYPHQSLLTFLDQFLQKLSVSLRTHGECLAFQVFLYYFIKSTQHSKYNNICTQLDKIWWTQYTNNNTKTKPFKKLCVCVMLSQYCNILAPKHLSINSHIPKSKYYIRQITPQKLIHVHYLNSQC